MKAGIYSAAWHSPKLIIISISLGPVAEALDTFALISFIWSTLVTFPRFENRLSRKARKLIYPALAKSPRRNLPPKPKANRLRLAFYTLFFLASSLVNQMRYTVIGFDGSEYGPVDAFTLEE